MENGVSGAITDMDTLLRHPATVGAARLTGNTNFLPAAAYSGGVKLDGWGIALPLEAAITTDDLPTAGQARRQRRWGE